MKRLAIPLILVAWLWGRAVLGQDLKVEGSTSVVKVDRQITISEDLLVVNKFPFTIKAAPGGFLYSFSYPASFESVKKANTLVVSKGPNGRTTFSAEWAVVDFDRKTVDIKTASVEFSVGAPDPKPPDPKPPDVEPTDLIWPSLKAAWLADPSPTKAADKDRLAGLFAQSAIKANDPTITKALQLKNIVRDARISLMGERLPDVRKVINDESQRILPTAVDADLNATNRDLYAKNFNRFADLLRRLP